MAVLRERRPKRRLPSGRAHRTVLSGLLLIASACDSPGAPSPPTFERVQPDLFAEPGAQPNAWADFDRDGDLDLFVGMRYSENQVYRNDDQIFVDVAPALGVDLVGTTRQPSWVDYDGDGDLDVHVSNQNGDEDAFYRNEGNGSFVDVAPGLGMNHPGRADEYGSVAPAVADYDNDGDLDLFIATYGPDILWSNNGDGTFTDVTDPATVGEDYHSTTAAWGDVDNDGRPDLVVTSYLSGVAEAEDHLFMNLGGGRFANALPASGRTMVPGAEVQLIEHDSGSVLGTRLVDSGGGYCSQGGAPAHFGIPAGVERVDVRVTYVVGGQRSTVVEEGVFPPDYMGRWLIVRQGMSGEE